MELRRALLLFAIVLGVAAVVTSLSSSSRNDDRSVPATPPPAITTDTSRGLGAADPTVRFNADRAPATKALRAGRAGTVTVSSEQPGEVRIDSLGLSAAVEPSSPARFDIYATQAGRHRISLEAVGGVQKRSLGVLAIQPAR